MRDIGLIRSLQLILQEVLTTLIRKGQQLPSIAQNHKLKEYNFPAVAYIKNLLRKVSTKKILVYLQDP